MSVPEETSKVATSAIDALKGNPLCLAVVFLTIVMAIITYLRESKAMDDRMQVVTTLVERCMEPAKR